MLEPGNPSSRIIMEGGGRVVGVVASREIEPIVRRHPLVMVSPLADHLANLLARPLGKLRHMLPEPRNNLNPMLLGARWKAEHV